MKTIFYSIILTSFIFADGNFETRLILFLVFIALGGVGYKFITLRTGNYDIDYFTKLLGWMLIIPAIWGILDSLNII
tara:strand:+ start:733 stop:963 length:231 start_codon:yes stop_codon:yes gene_type:complete